MRKPQILKQAPPPHRKGELLHQSNREEILKLLADILCADVDASISDKKDHEYVHHAIR